MVETSRVLGTRVKASMWSCSSSQLTLPRGGTERSIYWQGTVYKLFLFSAVLGRQVWIFDGPGGTGRVLRSRMGHSAPPTKIRYHGQNGEQILSAGMNSSYFSIWFPIVIKKTRRAKWLCFSNTVYYISRVTLCIYETWKVIFCGLYWTVS